MFSGRISFLSLSGTVATTYWSILRSDIITLALKKHGHRRRLTLRVLLLLLELQTRMGKIMHHNASRKCNQTLMQPASKCERLLCDLKQGLIVTNRGFKNNRGARSGLQSHLFQTLYFGVFTVKKLNNIPLWPSKTCMYLQLFLSGSYSNWGCRPYFVPITDGNRNSSEDILGPKEKDG